MSEPEAENLECPLCGDRSTLVGLCLHLRQAHPELPWGGGERPRQGLSEFWVGDHEFHCYCGGWFSLCTDHPWASKALTQHWEDRGGLAAHLLEILLLGRPGEHG